MIGRYTPFEKAWFEQRIKNHPLKDRIEVISFIPRDALIEYYQTAKLYVFPSLFEGSPRSLREAIACGTSALASDIPGHRGIDPHGDFIRFAPVGDLDSWVHLAREALRESPVDYQNRTHIGIQRLINYHHPHRVADQWSKLYRTVAVQLGLASYEQSI